MNQEWGKDSKEGFKASYTGSEVTLQMLHPSLVQSQK